MPDKKQISITLTDLDDVRKVLNSLNHLFKEIIMYYTEKTNNNDNIDIFLLTIANYIGTLLRVGGYDKDFLEDK